jgi:hypothetical protein
LGCNPANPAGSLGSATATDACGATTITQSDGAIVTTGCNRSQTRTFTARDACNNTTTISRIVTWTVDITPPTFTGSYTTVALGCNPANPAGSLGSAAATDACGATTVTQSDGSVVTTGCNRSQTRTFLAIDACNNTATISRTVTWTDDNSSPPVFTGSYTTVTLGCNPANPAGSLGSATATDACGAVTITSSDGLVVSTGCDRSQTRTFTARDACNNTATISRTVTWTSDITAPVFTGSYTTVALGCNPANPAGSLGSAAATDACGATTITQSDGAIVTTGCNRSQTRTFAARDACNNTATVSRIVTWTVDITPPTLTCPSLQTFCQSGNNTYTIPALTATDNCTGTLNTTYTISGATTRSGSGNNASGTYNLGPSTITWTVVDACGNSSSCSTTVTINPNTVITSQPQNVEVCEGGSATFSVTATGLNLTYQWQEHINGNNWGNIAGATGPTFTISPVTLADDDRYQVVVTGQCGAQTSQEVTLTVNALPACSITGTNIICSNETTSFAATAATSYSWTGPGGFTATTQSTGNISVAGTYTVTLTTSSGCQSSCSRTLTVNPAATATAGSPQTICAGESVTLNGTIGGSATSSTWSAPSGTFSDAGSLPMAVALVLPEHQPW